MKNNKGFVFIETIITIVFLISALLFIYKNFTDVLIKEKTRVHYDDIAYIYRTHYIKEYFSNYSNTNAWENIISRISDDAPMMVIGCGYEGLMEDTVSCQYNMDELEVYSIVLAKSDLSFAKQCKTGVTESYACSYLNNLSAHEIEYIKTLGKLNSEEHNFSYVMIIEYRINNLANGIVDYDYAWIEV